MKFKPLLIFLLLLSGFLISQDDNEIDSLLSQSASLADTDTNKIQNLYKVSFIYTKQGQTDSAIKYALKAYRISSYHNDTLKAKIHYILGQNYYNNQAFKESIVHAINAVRIFENQKNKSKIASCFNIIALAYQDQEIFNLAEYYHLKTIKTRIEIKDSANLAASYSNVGLYYYQKARKNQKSISYRKDMDLAKEYLLKAIDIAVPHNLINIMANAYGNLALVLTDSKDFKNAIKYANEAKYIYNKLGDAYQEAISNLDIASIYSAQNNINEAVMFAKTAKEIADNNNFSDVQRYAIMLLIDINEKTENYKEGFNLQKKIIALNDTLFHAENLKQVNEMQVQFETEQKETENKLLTVQNQLASNSIKNQQIVIVFVIIGLIIASVFAIFIFKGLKKQRLANLIISEQKIVLENKNQLIEQQKHIVEEKQKEILDSINYAKRIQYTLLAHDEFLKENLPEHFTYFNPKDIVSGDFYWATKHNNKFYLAVCDSTGHGVPGAFMSLLNIGFLSEAINEKGIEKPNEVFNYVRQKLTNTISKEGQKDGFDGILICIDKSTNKITYAAANNAPVLIQNNKLIELESNRMPVGVGERKEDFKLYTIDAKPGDTLYLYTDGYADQFGGPKGKKFKYKQLNETLLAHHTKSLSEQKDILKQTFDKWRGDLEQVDDVCIIGIRL